MNRTLTAHGREGDAREQQSPASSQPLTETMRDIRKYEVFQTADRLVVEVYRLTSHFPRSEAFGLVAQARRAAASIPMNLVEGAARSRSREFGQFINVAIGSCEELRYQQHSPLRLGTQRRKRMQSWTERTRV